MIIYRMSSNLSTHEPPFFTGKKDKIVDFCLKSFKGALGHRLYQLPIHFILDNCPSYYEDIIRSYFRYKISIEYTELGNYASTLKTYIKALETQDDWFFFVEDDYVWDKGAVTIIEKAIPELKLISPYDHPDYYTADIFKKDEPIRFIAGHHFRGAVSNTMTFACTREVLETHYDLFQHKGSLDSDLFTELPVKLWTPVPTLATHFVHNKLAPRSKIQIISSGLKII